MTPKVCTTVAALCAAALLSAGCGSANEPTRDANPTQKPQAKATPSGPAKQATKVDIASFKFAPASISVKAGGTVTWTNSDTAPHTAQKDGSGGFDTGTLNKGDSKRIKFSKPGTYSYFCAFHKFMKGTVQVR